ncbi:stage III sporulation protein AE [Rubeoparvulum massiliense]|uniref:stage III sporulation protein AE n=1 Tax=Rubeoparvulum massiliense TaxID=1631346 RepID=UPI00069FADA0|nr:stage III sporulation protein AE [Rubeoparvulum massiliense]
MVPRVLLIILLVSMLFTLSVEATTMTPFMEQQANQLNLERVEDYWWQIIRDYGGYLPELQQRTLMEQITESTNPVSVATIFQRASHFFLHEVILNIKLLGTILLLTVFSMILQTMQNAFEQNTVSKVAYAITYLVLFILVINSFHVAISYARDAIGQMSHFMLAIIPLILTIMATTGSLASVALFHPLIIFMVNISSNIISNVVFPFLFFSAVIGMVSSITERFPLSQLAGLLRKVSLGIMGVLLTIFLGVISVQGATSAVTDGIAIRTAKYVTSNFVPVVGRMFSDAADTVMSASYLIKNSVGLVGVIVVVILCAFPAMKILSLSLIYQLSSALMQPLGKNPIIDVLYQIGRNMMFVFAALATIGLLFFLTITMIISAGNISLMVR